jgi:hypothetical protein
VVGAERLCEVDRIVAAIRAWAVADEHVRAVVVVGSYAAGRPRTSSDLDLVIVVSTPERWLPDIDGVSAAVGVHAAPVRERDWGRLRERRFRTPTGLDIDLGIVALSWLGTPVDPGTARVLRDGCQIVFDPEGVTAETLHSLGVTVRHWAGMQ